MESGAGVEGSQAGRLTPYKVILVDWIPCFLAEDPLTAGVSFGYHSLAMAYDLDGGLVTLMLDCDTEGENGAQQALAMLTEHGPVRLAWNQQMHNSRFSGRQPESLNTEEWELLCGWLWNSGPLRLPDRPPPRGRRGDSHAPPMIQA